MRHSALSSCGRRAGVAVAVLLSLSLVGLGGCPRPEVTPLIGEDPEVSRLLGTAHLDDPAASPLAAARRLHQALMQDDTNTVWALLAEPTRRALDERGAVIAASGRELIDRSALPAASGAVRTVRYETIFFGPRLVDLQDPAPGAPGEERQLLAVSEDGATRTIRFVREPDAWKLLATSF